MMLNNRNNNGETMPFKPGTSGNPAGRPKGIINKSTKATRQAIADSGLTPLDFALGILRDEDAEIAQRMWACGQAMPYVHARLAHQTYSGPGGGNIVVEIVRFIEGTGPTIEGEVAKPVATEALPVKALALP